jgi:PhnB protein
MDSGTSAAFAPSIAPWLTVRDGARAVEFYKSAFEATEVYRLEDPSGGLVVRLSVSGAEFWISAEPPNDSAASAAPVGGGSVRMILTVADPDGVFAQALAAGASEVFPVGEGHGWRLGRLVDPFGLHWEIGHQLAP